MNLYLVRHAEAAAKELDAARNLTDQGAQDAQRLAEMLRPMNLQVSEIWHSGKLRALQTAQAIARSVNGPCEIVLRDGLRPFDPVKPVAKIIGRSEADLMIVGHEPFLGRLASRLVTGRASTAIVALDKPSIVCVSRDDMGSWRVGWMLSPRLFPPFPRTQDAAEPAADDPLP